MKRTSATAASSFKLMAAFKGNENQRSKNKQAYIWENLYTFSRATEIYPGKDTPSRTTANERRSWEETKADFNQSRRTQPHRGGIGQAS